MKKKSGSSRCSAGSEALGSHLRILNPKLMNLKGSEKVSVTITATSYKEPPIVIEDFYKARKPRKSKIAPALRSDRIGLKVVSGLMHGRGFETRKDELSHAIKGALGGGSKNFVASGRTTTTNTPAKSTGKGSGTRSLSRGTSGTSERRTYLSMIFLQRDFPARLLPLRENARVFKTKQGELFSTKYAELLEVKDQNTYSLRMLKDYFLTTRAEPSQSYSFRWMSLGTMSSGRCSTLSIGCPRTAKGSLSSVLEERADEKYYLSNKMLEYIDKKTHHEVPVSSSEEELKSPIRGQGDKPFILQLARGKNRGGIKEKISPALSASDFEHNNVVMVHNIYGGFGEKKPRVFKEASPTIRTPKGGGHLPCVVADRSRTYAKKGRNLESPKPITNALSGVQKDNLLIANTVAPDAYLAKGERERVDGKAILTSMYKRRIRRLTPRECERLQGFPDDWTRVPAIGNDAGITIASHPEDEDEIIRGKIMSDTQRYKQMGNAVSVPVIGAIGRKILEVIQ